jgi:NAD(P)-dependent dehydrogenase (short-subunit alcohol dehydrogenase family)
MASGGVVVTGVSSGIGRACALELDRRGLRVFGGVRAEGDAESIRREASDRFAPLILDVTDADAISRARETVERALGSEPLAGVVNNAGIAVGGPLEALRIEDLRRQLEVNTIAPVAVTQAFIPRLRASRGRVVNISSIGGRVAQPFLGPYSASKFGLEALSDALRRELLPWGIHVALIEPGNVKTRIWEKGNSQLEEFRARATEEQMRLYSGNLGRMEKMIEMAERNGVAPEKVAGAVAHALTADRPRTRYLVGPDARVQLSIDRALPTRLVDRLYARFLRG